MSTDISFSLFHVAVKWTCAHKTHLTVILYKHTSGMSVPSKLFFLFYLKKSKTFFSHFKPSVRPTGGAGQPDARWRQHCVGSAPGHHEARLLGRPHHLPHPEAPQDEQVGVWHHAAGGPPLISLRAAVATRRRNNVVNTPAVCLQGTAASTKNKLPTLITSMETIGAKALEEFADSIKVNHSHVI